MPGVKTNEVAGTRAVLRHYRMSAYKAREVLDLIRGRDADRAEEILNATPREAARVVHKVLASAVANARNNEQLDPDDLYVSACYADEGTTLKRWRPRARGRATRIRKRTCHITVIVSRLPEDRLERRRARQSAVTTGLRSRRVAASRRGEGGRGDERDALGPEEPTETTVSENELEEIDTASDDTGGVEGDAEGSEIDAELVVDDEDEVDVEESVSSDDGAEAHEDDGAEPQAVIEDEVVEEEPPAPKPRRTRGARKSTTKAVDSDDGDAGGAGEEEKG